MFTTFVVQPIFNLLVFIYALLPGHNFGVALIIFTIIIRLLLWPLLKKQLHQTKAMRNLQPEIKKIKQKTKGNRTLESQMLMELYKEKGINPIGTLPILIIQLIVLLGLYSGLRKVIDNPETLYSFAYPPLQNMSWIQQLHDNVKLFDDTFLGFIDLSKAAINKGTIYWPAMALVIGSAAATYFQSKQLLPQDKEQRGLRNILKEASGGKQADQSEINAAVGRSTLYFMPVMIFFFTVSLPAALSLYWLTSGIVAIIQQSIILNRDEEEMEEIADRKGKDVKSIPEAEIVETPAASGSKTTKPKSKKAGKKRKKKR